METQLLVLIGNEWRSLDLSQIIPISVTIQQLDITDFSVVKSPFSKTFTIPATQNNNKIFENYYEVNGTDFNPYFKLECVVTNRGKIIFQGFLRLNAVIENPTFREYEVFILSPVSNFSSEIRELELQDLDYSDLLHDLEYSAITTSWAATADSNNGLFNGDILYPLINYGLIYQGTGTTADFSYSFTGDTGFYLSGHSLPSTIFKPSIRLKSVVDRLFDKTTYTYTSDFFDTEYFKSVYMDTFTNGKLGIEAVSAVTNENKFKVYTNTSAQPAPVFTLNGDLQLIPINWRGILPDGYDPLNNFTLGTTNVVAPDNEGYFQVPYPGVYGFNIRFNYSSPNPFIPQRWYIVANKGTSLIGLENQPSFDIAGPFISAADGSEQSTNIIFTGDCNAGEYVKIYILADPVSSPTAQIRLTGYDDGVIASEPFPTWELYYGPEFATEDYVDIRLGMPNLKAVDFFKALVKMFNLIVVETPDSSVLKIEPFNWYFDDPTRTEKDWSTIFDLNSQHKVEPLNFNLSKEQTFTYAPPEFEVLGRDFETSKEYTFGRYKFISEGDILTGENVYELPFRSVPTQSLDGAPNFIIPAVYQLEAGRQEPYSDKPHLFFWSGNRYAYKDVAKTIPGYWYLSSGATPVQQTTYPCVSHLSSLDIQVPNLISDLNFGFDIDFFSTTNTAIVQNTPYTLYNTFWNDYISNTYSPETKRLTGRFFFQPLDAYETKLTDKIFVKDSYYMIEKINEIDLVSDKLTEVSLIKERGGYDKVIPPPPQYSLEGGEAYPAVLPVFNTLCFYSLDGTEVCDNTAPTQLLYSFGPGDFQYYQKVYYDSGTALVLLPVGTFFKAVSGTQRWIVADSQGRIIPVDC